MVRKDGGEFPVMIYSTPITRDGAPVGLRGIVVDISARKQTEAELRRLSRAVEQSANTVVITDTKGYIEYVNPKFTETTGYSREEAVGQHTRILKSGETSADEYKGLWETIASGNEWQGEFHNKRKKGELFARGTGEEEEVGEELRPGAAETGLAQGGGAEHCFPHNPEVHKEQ